MSLCNTTPSLARGKAPARALCLPHRGSPRSSPRSSSTESREGAKREGREPPSPERMDGVGEHPAAGSSLPPPLPLQHLM